MKNYKHIMLATLASAAFTANAQNDNTDDSWVTSSGNTYTFDKVGVGKQNTSSILKLDVNGYGQFQEGLIINRSSPNSAYLMLKSDDVGVGQLKTLTNQGFGFYTDKTPTARFTLFSDNNGDIGIGTTSPTTNLHVSSSLNNTGIRIQSNNNQALYFAKAGIGNIAIGRDGARGSFNVNFSGDISNSSPQFTVEPGGFVGIGTANPGASLEIGNGSTTQTGIILRGHNSSDPRLVFRDNLANNIGSIGFDHSTSTTKMYISSQSPTTGRLMTFDFNQNYVGIGEGSDNPEFTLDVLRKTTPNFITEKTLRLRQDDGREMFFTTANCDGCWNYLMKQGDFGFIFNDKVQNGSDNSSAGLVIAPKGGTHNGIRINALGNVGIGTNLDWDVNNEYKLAVNGKLRAKEVRVEITGWGDFVFEDDYKLLSLDEVETFVEKEGHLPNVPAAAEIEKDAYSLGELTKIQQVKIEELTLYLIEMKKELEALKAQVQQ